MVLFVATEAVKVPLPLAGEIATCAGFELTAVNVVGVGSLATKVIE